MLAHGSSGLDRPEQFNGNNSQPNFPGYGQDIADYALFLMADLQAPSNNCNNYTVGFPSGQREQTVNLSAKPTEVRILPPPPA